MSKKINSMNTELEAIASATDFPETLKTSALQGQTFTIDSVRLVTTENGARYVGQITLEGEPQEAWLSGSKLHQQVEFLESQGFPVTVLLTKGEGQFDPYLLQVVA